MATTIWKKQLQMVDKQLVQLPRGSEILFVGVQDRNLCIWFRCDPRQPLEARPIGIVGTGHPYCPEAEDSRYIGSVIQPPFVWHVFEPKVA